MQKPFIVQPLETFTNFLQPRSRKSSVLEENDDKGERQFPLPYKCLIFVFKVAAFLTRPWNFFSTAGQPNEKFILLNLMSLLLKLLTFFLVIARDNLIQIT